MKTLAMEALLKQMRQMRAGDISVLEAGLNRPGRPNEFHMMTRAGSANDALWSEMEKLGWMVREDHTLNLSDGRSLVSPAYTITAAGREPIAHLLAAFMKGRAHDAKLVEIHNRLCRELVPQIVEPMRAAGGAPADVLTLLMSITFVTLKSCLPPGDRERALEQIMANVRRRLAE